MAFHPLIDAVGDVEEGRVPLFNLLKEGSFEGRETHGLRENDVLIKHTHGLIEAEYRMGTSVLEGLERELEGQPTRLHCGHTGLDVVFLTSSLTDINDRLSVGDELHVDAVLEGESFVRLDFLAYLLGKGCPMPIFHTLSPESHDNGYLRGKILDVCLKVLSDFENLGELFVPEGSDDLGHRFLGVVDSFFHISSIDLIERTVEPALVLGLPGLDSGPEIVEWFEFLLHLSNTLVVGHILVFNHAFPVVDEFGLLVRLIDSLFVALGHRTDLLIVVHIEILLECAGQVLEICDLSIEVLLGVLHLLDELFLLFLEEALLLLDPLDGLEWSSVHSPHLVVLFFVIKLVVEHVEGAIDLLAVFDLSLLLLKVLWQLGHELLDTGELLNVLGNTLNFDVELFEFLEDVV